MKIGSAWRARLPLFVVLGLLLAGNAVLLVSYNLFYDERFRTLLQTEKELVARQEEARRSLKKVEASEQRLQATQKALESFFADTLGSRRERLAPILEEVYKTTRKARLRPAGIQYAEAEIPGGSQLQLTFGVEGTYADIKALLAAFEESDSFFVVEGVAVSLNDAQPDSLRVGLTVVRYFRPEASLTPRRNRGPARPTSSGGPPQ